MLEEIKPDIMNKNNYQIEVNGDMLIFKTSSFTDEKGSVLHSGIYNIEFASALSSAAVAGMVYTILVMNFKKTIFNYIAVILILLAGFPLFRKFVFKGRYLETVFNRTENKARILLHGFIKRQKDEIKLNEINNIFIEKKQDAVENPDAVEFVKKISAQHGTVIPGFGEESILFLLKLRLTSGKEIIIYSDTKLGDVMNAHQEIKDFLRL